MPETHYQFNSSALGKPLNVLIVEDNLIYRTAVKNLLTARFTHIIIKEAASGKEALAGIHNFSPDLVLLDIKLPDQNGLSLINKIKRKHGSAIVIVLTAYDSNEYRYQALQNGASYFCVKTTISTADILALVESVMADPPSHGPGQE
jgi:DNA-binding NarL/FixJ family response regulator